MTERLSLAFLTPAAPRRQTAQLPSQQLQEKDCVLTFPTGAGGLRVLAHGHPLHPQIVGTVLLSSLTSPFLVMFLPDSDPLAPCL